MYDAKSDAVFSLHCNNPCAKSFLICKPNKYLNQTFSLNKKHQNELIAC